ncbi:hypothetical protein JCM16303_005456 [Sporobolomyces ruberrimus]
MISLISFSRSLLRTSTRPATLPFLAPLTQAQYRPSSNWSKYIDPLLEAARPKPVPVERTGPAKVLGEARAGLEEYEKLSGFKDGTSSNSKTRDHPSSMDSGRSSPPPQGRKRQASPRRSRRDSGQKPLYSGKKNEHLPRMTAPEFRTPGTVSRSDVRNTSVTELEGRKKVFEGMKSQETGPAPPQTVKKLVNQSLKPSIPPPRPARPVESIAVPSSAPIRIASSPTPAAAISISTLGLGVNPIPYRTLRDRGSVGYNSVELEPIPKPRKSTASTSSTSVKSANIAKEKSLETPPVVKLEEKAIAQESFEVPPVKKLEGQKLAEREVRRVSLPSATPSVPVPSTTSPPPAPIPTTLPIHQHRLGEYEQLRQFESWMHPRGEHTRYWPSRPSTGYHSFFSPPSSPITRRANLQSFYLHKLNWIKSYRARQDAIRLPTKEIVEERKLVDAKLERQWKLDIRSLQGKEGLIEEQEASVMIDWLNKHLLRLERLERESLAWHESISRDPETLRNLVADYDRLISEYVCHGTQPPPFPPRSYSGVYAIPQPPPQAILFADVACTKPYSIPFATLNKMSPHGPYHRGGIARLGRVQRKREKEIEQVWSRISLQGWNSLRRNSVQ